MSELLATDRAVETLLARARLAGWQPLNRTQIAKLLYFVDLRGVATLEQPVTAVNWVWDNYGPFDSGLYRALDLLISKKRVVGEEVDNGFDKMLYQIAADAPELPTDPEVLAVFDDVLREYRGQTATQLRVASYATGPMLVAQAGGERGVELDLFAGSESAEAALRYEGVVKAPVAADGRSQDLIAAAFERARQ